MSEDQAEYVTEAMELLHGEPAAIIEQPAPRMVLRDGIGEEWTVAWVKLSTAFKPHIKELRGAPLAVWLYIALCVNKSGVSFPSISKIADDTGYSRQGVLDAIAKLEEKGYLKVRRGERRFNLYEPEFAAIGRINEPSRSVNLVDSSAKESSFDTDRSSFDTDWPSPLDLNKRNKIKKQDIKAVAEKPQTPDEVKLYRSVVERFPPHEAYDFVVESISKIRDRLGRAVIKEDLKPFRLAWVTRGYNRNSMSWLEWAETGQIPANGNRKPKREEPQGFDAIRKFREAHANG